eukprot:32378-Rhodomonas_salina.1
MQFLRLFSTTPTEYPSSYRGVRKGKVEEWCKMVKLDFSLLPAVQGYPGTRVPGTRAGVTVPRGTRPCPPGRITKTS